MILFLFILQTKAEKVKSATVGKKPPKKVAGVDLLLSQSIKLKGWGSLFWDHIDVSMRRESLVDSTVVVV